MIRSEQIDQKGRYTFPLSFGSIIHSGPIELILVSAIAPQLV